MRHFFLYVMVPAFCASLCAQTAPLSANAAETAQTSEVQLQTARGLAARGRLDQAMALLDGLAAKQPEAAGVERLRGLIFYQRNQLKEALEAFEKAAAEDGSDSEALEMEGVTLYRLGRPADAIPLLEKGRSPVLSANVDPQYVLGLCYIDAGRYENARRAFADQFGFQPESPEAYLLIARLMLRRNFADQADAAARKALDENPKLPLAHELLGEISLAKADLRTAARELRAEIAINPLAPSAYERLGDALLRSGDYGGARIALNRAVLLEPNSTAPFILLGQVFLKMQQPIEALHYLTHAASMDPGNYITHNFLGQAYKATGQTEEARREFQMVVELQKKQESAAGGK
jgi:tetratricopeptide (TPR) repeat protein